MSKIKKPEDEPAPVERPNTFAETTPWLNFVWGGIRNHAEARGMELPSIRWTYSFTEHGKSLTSMKAAQLIFGDATVDGRIEGIVRWKQGEDHFIVREMAKLAPMAIAGGPEPNAMCRSIADRLGFETTPGGLRNPGISAPLQKVLERIAEEAGPFPHQGIKFDVLNQKRGKVMTGAKAPQKGRMLKVVCRECEAKSGVKGNIIRQSQGVIQSYGIATCRKHGEMSVELKPDDKPVAEGIPSFIKPDNKSAPAAALAPKPAPKPAQDNAAHLDAAE